MLLELFTGAASAVCAPLATMLRGLEQWDSASSTMQPLGPDMRSPNMVLTAWPCSILMFTTAMAQARDCVIALLIRLDRFILIKPLVVFVVAAVVCRRGLHTGSLAILRQHTPERRVSRYCTARAHPPQ